MKRLILAALVGGAALTGGCATGPYYDGYGYSPDSYGYPGYQDGYAYDPYYYGPSAGVGFGVTFSDQDRYWRDHGQRWRDGGGRWHDGDNRWRDRGTSDPVVRNNNGADIRNNNGTPLWSQGDTYRGTGPNYDPSKDHGQYSPG